jgi:Asp-tRNA(Asn)/Glu-tRNA(Gln) amidotransferase A subunit family amidase
VPPELFAGPEAICVQQLRAAGALIVGKTVTTEFAFFEPGPTRNPHNLAHTPGGSSSGSAAAVAAGLCTLALGTQTIGSVIRPAAFCGIVGFKPSYDRIATPGLVYFSRTADHVGLFTQDVAGMALAASVLCRDWQPQPASARLPVLGIPAGPYLAQTEPAAMTAFEREVTKLQDGRLYGQTHPRAREYFRNQRPAPAHVFCRVCARTCRHLPQSRCALPPAHR